MEYSPELSNDGDTEFLQFNELIQFEEENNAYISKFPNIGSGFEYVGYNDGRFASIWFQYDADVFAHKAYTLFLDSSRERYNAI